jgi:predicted transcriptional regulator YheO
MIRVGLIKKSIENLFQHQVSWIGADHGTGLVYGINEFYHKYCTYKKYPKWVWTKHRKQLVSNAMRYAQRLHENGLFCFEMVLGYLYIQNQRLSSKIIKYEVLEKKARWVTAKTYERIDRGDFKKLEDAELQQARSVAGKKGADASATVRKAKSQQQKTQVKKLFDKGYSVNEIVGRLSISKRTVYRYIKE